MADIQTRNWQRMIEARAIAMDAEGDRLEREEPKREQAGYYEGYNNGVYSIKLQKSGKTIYSRPEGLQTNGAIARGAKVMISQSPGANPLFHAMPNG